jgi:hypothetical protein
MGAHRERGKTAAAALISPVPTALRWSAMDKMPRGREMVLAACSRRKTGRGEERKSGQWWCGLLFIAARRRWGTAGGGRHAAARGRGGAGPDWRAVPRSAVAQGRRAQAGCAPRREQGRGWDVDGWGLGHSNERRHGNIDSNSN